MKIFKMPRWLILTSWVQKSSFCRWLLRGKHLSSKWRLQLLRRFLYINIFVCLYRCVMLRCVDQSLINNLYYLLLSIETSLSFSLVSCRLLVQTCSISFLGPEAMRHWCEYWLWFLRVSVNVTVRQLKHFLSLWTLTPWRYTFQLLVYSPNRPGRLESSMFHCTPEHLSIRYNRPFVAS